MSESQQSTTESYTILDWQLPLSTQEISTLDNNLGKTVTETGWRQSANSSISMQIPETARVLQVDQKRPPINEMYTSDHDLEKSGTSDSEKDTISTPVLGTDTLDIEHVPVQNDPREWSSFRKVSFLTHNSPFLVLLRIFLLSTFQHSILPW